MSGKNYKVSQDALLLEYLFQILPGQSRTGVKNMLTKGQILVNGESRTAFNQPLKKGDSITILPKGISIARATRNDARSEVEKAGVKFLFEDENYIVVDKPSGMLTVATGKEKKTLYALLNAYIKVNARMQRKEDLLSGREPCTPPGPRHLRRAGLRQERKGQGHPPEQMEGPGGRKKIRCLAGREAGKGKGRHPKLAGREPQIAQDGLA